jgi:serpin B
VRIELPRFAVTGSHGLKPALAALGLRAAFDPGRADFTGITTDEPLVIDDVVHQAWIQVDEEGAEAAAATAIVMKVGSKRPDGEPKLFRADHPFAFGLRDRKTGLLLFVGRVTDPRGKRG